MYNPMPTHPPQFQTDPFFSLSSLSILKSGKHTGFHLPRVRARDTYYARLEHERAQSRA